MKILEELYADKKPLGNRTVYMIHKVEYKGKVFYRRQKINQIGTITSVSYSTIFPCKKWESGLNKIIKKIL